MSWFLRKDVLQKICVNDFKLQVLILSVHLVLVLSKQRCDAVHLNKGLCIKILFGWKKKKKDVSKIENIKAITIHFYFMTHPRIITWRKHTFYTLRLRPPMGLTKLCSGIEEWHFCKNQEKITGPFRVMIL